MVAVKDFITHFGEVYPNGVQNSNDVQDSIETPTRTWSDIADSCICSINRFNNDPMYAGQDLNKNVQLQKQYDAIVTKAFNDRLVSMSVMPMNKIDAGAFLYSFDRKAQRLIPVPVQVAHQDKSYEFPTFSVNLDDTGFIVGIKAIKPKNATDAMWQSSLDPSNFVTEYIEHHGIKGQRWGIRNRRKPPKFGSSKDAKRTSQSIKKAKHSSVSSLTTKELKDLTQRMELERKYRTGLPPSAVKKGKNHVKGILGTLGITSVAALLAFPETKHGKIMMKKISSLYKKPPHNIYAVPFFKSKPTPF